MRDFPCESQAFPVSRQKHYSAHFVLHCPNTGRGTGFTTLPCRGAGLYAHTRACASGTFRFLPSRFTWRRQI